MPRIRQPLWTGMRWGLALGVAAGLASIAAPGLKSLAQQAAGSYTSALNRATRTASGAGRGLQQISVHREPRNGG